MKKKFIIEQLEERLMLSADFQPIPFDGGLPYDDWTTDLSVVETPLVPASSASDNAEDAEQRHELVFIDSMVSEYQKLVDDIMAKQDNGTHYELIVLNSSSDGIKQISDRLNQYSNIDAVHLFSHGSDGAVQLGDAWLTLDTLDRYADSMEGWKNSLSNDADLLFYGCNLAEGESGQALVENLGILTGADIAASDDLTGVKELGGNWELEVTSGHIETIELHASYVWQGVLDLVNVNAAADTYIDNGDSDENYGNSPSLILDHSGGGIGDQRILMQFDLSGVPAGSTITGATLKMNATGNTGAFDINIYALTEAWVEGTGDGTSGVASWDERQAATPWTTPGGEYDPAIVATLNTALTGQHTWDITSLVQDWYTGTIANHGLIIGSSDGGGDSVTYDSDEKGTGIRPVLEINYTPPAGNTQPVLDNSANLALNSVAEDAGVPSVGDGTLISDLVDLVDGSGHDNVTDPDSGAVTGIALTNVNTSNGTWYYSTDNGNNWALISDVVDPATIAPNNAFVLAADGSTRIYFRPNADYTGTISNAIKFRSWDQTDGLASGDIADTTPSSAYSSTPDQAVITVDPVNDAPVVTAPGSALSATEQTALNIHGPAMFSVSDVDAASSGVMATLSVGEGTLTIAEGDSGVIINGGNGTGTVVISGTIAEINALLTGAGTGTITYLNPSNNPGASTTLTVTVNDQGNTGTDPGTSGDASSEEGTNNVTINITAVNDTPVATANTVSTNEDTPYAFKTADFTYTDAETDTLVSVTITNQNLAGGTLKLNGVDVTNGDTILAADISNLIYTPAGEANGVPLATFDFTVNDADAGTVAAQMNIDVSAQNDAPQATANTVSTNEDNPYTFKASDFTFTDMESNSLVSITITNQNLAGGTLQLSGMNVNNGDTISSADIGNLVYSPAADTYGSALATFDFTVNDADPGTIAARMGIDVLSVADKPQAGNTATLPDTLSDPIVISPNASDGVEVSHFQITGITNGTLYQADGTTEINNGDYITLTQAQDGLKFQLSSNTALGSFNVRPSKDGVSVDPDSGSATPIITALSASTVPDTGDMTDEPIEEDQEIMEDTIADDPLNDSTVKNATLSNNPAQKKSFIKSDASAEKSGVYHSQVKVDFQPILERISGTQESDSSNILSVSSLEQQFNKLMAKLPDFSISYENLKHALDDFRKEAEVEMQDSETVIGSAIAVSTGLSVGYVIWMIRGGMLLSSLISSMPAWQLADPLPILKNTKNDEDEDDESLETIIKKSSDNDDKKKQDPDTTEI